MEMNAGTVDNDKKKKRLKTILYALGALFIILLIALIYFLLTQRPITAVIPGTPKVGPRYVKSIYGGFKELTGIAVNKKGDRVYAVDTQGMKVWYFNRDGKALGSFGVPVTDQTQPTQEGFAAPLFIAVGPKDEIYVTDRSATRISIYSPLGKFVKTFDPEPGTEFIWSPIAIAVDTKGNVYITDAKKGEHRVLKFDKNGKLLLAFGKQGTAAGEFSYANGIAVGKDGKIYVADSGNARVEVFDAKGKPINVIKGLSQFALSHPVGIDATRTGEIHVVESFGHDVQVYSSDGAGLYTFGRQGIRDGEFRYPQGIAIAGDGRVYVADRMNNRIQIWQY